MLVAISTQNPLVRPAVFKDVKFAKVFTETGKLFAVHMELDGGGVFTITADDPTFEDFCRSYGIAATRAMPMLLEL